MDKGDYMQLLAMARAHEPSKATSGRPRTAGTVSGTGSRRAQRLDEKYGGGGVGWINTFDRELPPPFGRCSAATIRKFNDNMLQERFGELRKVKRKGGKSGKKASSGGGAGAGGAATPGGPGGAADADDEADAPAVHHVSLSWSPAKSYHAYLRGNWGGAEAEGGRGAGGAHGAGGRSQGLSAGFPGMRTAPSYTFGERLKDPLARDERDTPGFRLVDEAFSHTSKCYRPPAFTMQGRWKEPTDFEDERERGEKGAAQRKKDRAAARRRKKGGRPPSPGKGVGNPVHKIGGYSVKMMPFGSKNLRRRYQM